MLNLFNFDFWAGYAKIRECKLRKVNSTDSSSRTSLEIFDGLIRTLVRLDIRSANGKHWATTDDRKG